MPTGPPHPLLDSITLWCVEQLPADHPKLVGVILGEASVSLQIVDLDVDDPLDDLAGLAAPDCWELLVVLCTLGRYRRGVCVESVVAAHGADRNGHCATEFADSASDPDDVSTAIERLDAACRSVLRAEPDAA